MDVGVDETVDVGVEPGRVLSILILVSTNSPAAHSDPGPAAPELNEQLSEPSVPSLRVPCGFSMVTDSEDVYRAQGAHSGRVARADMSARKTLVSESLDVARNPTIRSFVPTRTTLLIVSSAKGRPLQTPNPGW